MRQLVIILTAIFFGCSNKNSINDYSVKQLQLNLGYSFYNHFNVVINFDNKFIGLYSSNNKGDAREGVDFYSFKENLNNDDLVLIDSIIKEFDERDFETFQCELSLPDGAYHEMLFIENDNEKKVIIYDYIKNDKHKQLIKEVLNLLLKYNTSEQNTLIITEIL